MIGVRKLGIHLIPRIPPFLACQAVPKTGNEVRGVMYSSCRGSLLLYNGTSIIIAMGQGTGKCMSHNKVSLDRGSGSFSYILLLLG